MQANIVDCTKFRDEEIFAVQWRTSHKIKEKLSISRTEQAILQPFHKIPSPVVGHVPLQAKKDNKTRMDRLWTEIYRQYEDIVRLKTSEQEHAAVLQS